MNQENIASINNLTNIIEKYYNVKITSIKEIDRGTADLYNINNDSYIIKIFQDKYTEKEILKEVDIINILDKNNVPVPRYVKTLDNKYYIKCSDRFITMQEFIKGKEIDPNTGDINMLIDSAAMLGKIAKSLNKGDLSLEKSDIKSWYSDECINNAIIKHEALLEIAKEKNENKIIKDIEYKIKMLKEIKNQFNFDELSKLTCLNTHGDYNVLQCIYNKNNKIIAVLDFVSACNMPITWELIRSYSYLDEKAANGTIDKNNLKIYIEEFIKYVDLNKYDLKYMCLLYYIQILTSTYGYKQYLRDSRRKQSLEFATFRTNICKYLEKNMDKISKELCKLK